MRQPDSYPKDRKKAVSVAWQCIARHLRGSYPMPSLRSIHTYSWSDGYELAKLLEREGANIHAQDIQYLDQLPIHINSMLKKQVWDWIHQHPSMKPNLRRGQTVWFQTIRGAEHLATPMIPDVGRVPLMGTIQEVSHQGLDQCRVKVLGSLYCYVAPWWDSESEIGIQPIWDNEMAAPRSDPSHIGMTRSVTGVSHH